MNESKPIIIQSDWTILLDVHSPSYEGARDKILLFAELIKTPEHIHTYHITHLSLWNASSSGLTYHDIESYLKKFSRYDIAAEILEGIKEILERYGIIELIKSDRGELILKFKTSKLASLFTNIDKVSCYLKEEISDSAFIIEEIHRGIIKQVILSEGYPVVDIAGYREARHLNIELQLSDKFQLRSYQENARQAFYKKGSNLGGSGVVVLPCGSGKTIIGISAIELCKCNSLILTSSTTAVKQWKEELLTKTSLTDNDIGEYTGQIKEIRNITVSTYQLATYNKEGDFIHFDVLNNQQWGLIIYDEVHLLPAQIFRLSSSLQSIRRLGLTATLIREDGREGDVFSLIGPKCFDIPWKKIEQQGWIAPAVCHEVRVPLSNDNYDQYACLEKRKRIRFAYENPFKIKHVQEIMLQHNSEQTLIIGQYITQLEEIAKILNFPLITGKTSIGKREKLFMQFKNKEVSCLVVSSVGNFAIDLPDASVAIQVSGKFGSRQEEAQRLGRLLRPKDKLVHFYTLVTKDTEDQEFALKRQMFLAEQGYKYNIIEKLV